MTLHHSKQCFKCHQTKPIIEFYKMKGMADGHLNKCKDCTKKDCLDYRRRNPERSAKIRAAYKKTPKGRRLAILARIEQQKKFPEKYKARYNASWGLQSGRIKKRKKCSRCRKIKKLAMHHEDYGKPLEVVWLCYVCHSIRHKEIENDITQISTRRR
jgi:hypothetical protein